jgi:hypothetical protein
MSRSKTGPRRRPCFPPRASAAAGLLAGAVLLAGALAGCGAPPELRPDTARQLQSQVLAVTEAAAAKDPAGSLKLLDALATRLDQAAASGDVSFRRHQSIRTAIDAVRADLTAQQAAAETARRAAEQIAAEQAAAAETARRAAEQIAAEQAAAAQAAAVAPPPAAVAPAPVPANTSKAKGKDKGKD